MLNEVNVACLSERVNVCQLRPLCLKMPTRSYPGEPWSDPVSQTCDKRASLFLFHGQMRALFLFAPRNTGSIRNCTAFGLNAAPDIYYENWPLTGLQFFHSRRLSRNFFPPLDACATWRAALGSAQGTDVNVQLLKRANQGAPVHSQHAGGFALVPIDPSEDDKDKLLPEFSQRF